MKITNTDRNISKNYGKTQEKSADHYLKQHESTSIPNYGYVKVNIIDHEGITRQKSVQSNMRKGTPSWTKLTPQTSQWCGLVVQGFVG